MKKLLKKTTRTITFLLALLMLFASCNLFGGEEDTAESTADTNSLPETQDFTLSDFQLVRPDKGASDEVKEAALELNRVIKAYLGKSLMIRTDYRADDETPCEILIGGTTRSQSQTAIDSLKDGDYIIKTYATENGSKIVLCGSNDTLTVSAVHAFIELIEENKVEKDGKIKTFMFKENLYSIYSNYTLSMSDPIVIAKGETYEELGWGPYQFPNLFYTTKGSIICRWHNSNDKFYGGTTFNIPTSAVSDDGGLTWRTKTDADVLSPVSNWPLMSNGKYFAGFSGQGTYEVDFDLSKYTPVIADTDGGTTLYRASDVTEYQPTVSINEYDPTTGKTTTYPCIVNWPNMPLDIFHENGKDVVYPLSKVMTISAIYGMMSIGDDLYYCTYARGFDLKTGAADAFSKYFSIYVFKSSDCGRTWDCISRVPINRSIVNESLNHKGDLEGFCEPDMTLMRDGSVVMLIRTGGNQPCYIVRSIDNCQTWSAPKKFDEVGVLPNIISLGCGVTLASYGREGLFLRSTSDATGMKWKDAQEIELSSFGEGKKTYLSCYYTHFLALDDHTVLWVYTDFYYSDTGKAADASKCVIARIITVEPVAD